MSDQAHPENTACPACGGIGTVPDFNNDGSVTERTCPEPHGCGGTGLASADHTASLDAPYPQAAERTGDDG